MIPAGLERDREIAETIYGKANVSIALDDKTVLIRKGPNEWGHYKSIKCPNFSTNIATAIKLLEEMIQHWDFVDISCCQRGHVVNLVMDLESFHNTHGNTLADAISGAWQKWKEGQ